MISSTGAREPILTRALFKQVTKARRWRPIVVIDIAVPRDAEPAIGELDGVYLFDIDDLEKVVAANLAERAKAAEHAGKIVEHEAGQFEHWLRTQGVVPTIRALRERLRAGRRRRGPEGARPARAQGAHARRSSARLIQRLVQLVVNKLLHQPTDGAARAPRRRGARCAPRSLCELFGLEPTRRADDAEPSPRQLPKPATEQAAERKAQA